MLPTLVALFQLQAQIEHVFIYPTKLACTGHEKPSADAIQTRSLPRLSSFLIWFIVRHRLRQGGIGEEMQWMDRVAVS